MTSYSGFSSRKLQDKHNQYMKQLISLLSQIIISQIDSSKIVPFKSIYQKLQNQIKKLDSQKYSQPKFSKVLQPLTQHMLQLDCVKQWQSEPQKKKHRHFVNNNFVRGRNGSIEQARRTISFSVGNSSKNQKQNFFKQNRYNLQQGLNDKQKQKIAQKFAENVRSKKIYRSRQTSLNLINTTDHKINFDQNQTVLTQENESNLSMQQLMKRNPLIERKMSAHRKRRLIKFDFPQIREEEQQGDEYHQENDERSTKSYFKFTPQHQEFSEIDDSQLDKMFIRT